MNLSMILNDAPCGMERTDYGLRGTLDELTEVTASADKVLVF